MLDPASVDSDWPGFDSDRDLILLSPDRKKHGSCAVVGSAPDLLGSGFGERIEAHDLVVRINYATSQGAAFRCFPAKIQSFWGFNLKLEAMVWP